MQFERPLVTDMSASAGGAPQAGAAPRYNGWSTANNEEDSMEVRLKYITSPDIHFFQSAFTQRVLLTQISYAHQQNVWAIQWQRWLFNSCLCMELPPTPAALKAARLITSQWCVQAHARPTFSKRNINKKRLPLSFLALQRVAFWTCFCWPFVTFSPLSHVNWESTNDDNVTPVKYSWN